MPQIIEAADLEIAKKLEDIKSSVLDLAEKMEQSPAISERGIRADLP